MSRDLRDTLERGLDILTREHPELRLASRDGMSVVRGDAFDGYRLRFRSKPRYVAIVIGEATIEDCANDNLAGLLRDQIDTAAAAIRGSTMVEWLDSGHAINLLTSLSEGETEAMRAERIGLRLQQMAEMLMRYAQASERP